MEGSKSGAIFQRNESSSSVVGIFLVDIVDLNFGVAIVVGILVIRIRFGVSFGMNFNNEELWRSAGAGSLLNIFLVYKKRRFDKNMLH